MCCFLVALFSSLFFFRESSNLFSVFAKRESLFLVFWYFALKSRQDCLCTLLRLHEEKPLLCFDVLKEIEFDIYAVM